MFFQGAPTPPKHQATTVPAASILLLFGRESPAAKASSMGQMVRRVPPNVFLIRAPRLAGMIATTTSVPGKRANNSPAGKSSLQVATRFTKGCVGERPAAKTAAKERAPTNPQKHDHTPTVHAHHSHPTTTEKPITPSPRSPCAPTTLAARDSFRDVCPTKSLHNYQLPSFHFGLSAAL